MAGEKMRTIKTTCPLDCWDQCALLVQEDQGKIISIGPDSAQPVTANAICNKGKLHLERLNHPDRLRYPMLKKGSNFKRIGWEEALQVMAEKIRTALDNYGPLSLLHFYDGGYTGILKNLESRFFSALGGCTAHKGSLCWGAGLAAQKYDFGEALSHSHEDLINSRLILIWGRNPADTSIHFLPFIQRARKNGTRVILIDPIRTATTAVSDQHIRVKPGSDGALALGLARIIIDNGLADYRFIENYCSGFDRFDKMTADYTLERVAEITGLEAEMIEKLAVDYAEAKPAAILAGIGLQRHSNGGNTVRAIDALAALSGYIGIPGGGVSYANFRASRYIDHAFLSGSDLKPERRYYAKPQLADALARLDDPPIAFLYISRANPLVQVGNCSVLRRVISEGPFTVTADHFMTDTAAAADLVLPSTSFLEEEGLYYNSMSHQYIGYGSQVTVPLSECRPEYDFLKELSVLLGIENFPAPVPAELLARAIRPLTEATGITLGEIKNNTPLMLPGGNETPWDEGVFRTPDRKFNFYSAEAENDGGDGLPLYRKPKELGNDSLHKKGFIYWFVTPHSRDSIHSTHRLPGKPAVPKAYLHPLTARREGLKAGEQVQISSLRGTIRTEAVVSEMVSPDTVMVYQGWWHSSGAAVNNLTPDRLTDIGCQAAYYDCLCHIEKVKNL